MPRPGSGDVPDGVAAGGGNAGLRVVATPAPSRRPARRRGLALLLAGVLASSAAAAWRWWPPPAQEWADGSAHDDWIAVYDGQGTTRSDGSTITLSPQAAAAPTQTHASLVVSVLQYEDVDLRATVRTVRQLRTGTPPNPWEVGWLVWHYDAQHRFSYFALKRNGWELGQVDPSIPGGQRFLATGGRPADAHRAHDVRVRQLGSSIDVWVDGAAVVRSERASRPGEGSAGTTGAVPGAVGLYSEDAVVEFSHVRVRPASLP